MPHRGYCLSKRGLPFMEWLFFVKNDAINKPVLLRKVTFLGEQKSMSS